jgi:transposase
MSMSQRHREEGMKAKSKQGEASKRRVRAGRLLLAGKTPPEVARMVGAPRQTVYRWREVLKVGGIEALRDIDKGGRPAQLGAGELSQLYIALLEGPIAHGFATPLWTLKRVRLYIPAMSECDAARACEYHGRSGGQTVLLNVYSATDCFASFSEVGALPLSKA